MFLVSVFYLSVVVVRFWESSLYGCWVSLGTLVLYIRQEAAVLLDQTVLGALRYEVVDFRPLTSYSTRSLKCELLKEECLVAATTE